MVLDSDNLTAGTSTVPDAVVDGEGSPVENTPPAADGAAIAISPAGSASLPPLEATVADVHMHVRAGEDGSEGNESGDDESNDNGLGPLLYSMGFEVRGRLNAPSQVKQKNGPAKPRSPPPPVNDSPQEGATAQAASAPLEAFSCKAAAPTASTCVKGPDM